MARPEAVNVNGLPVWVAVPMTFPPSSNVAVPVGAVNAFTASETESDSGTDVPKVIVSGEVVLRMEVVGASAPNSTLTVPLDPAVLDVPYMCVGKVGTFVRSAVYTRKASQRDYC